MGRVGVGGHREALGRVWRETCMDGGGSGEASHLDRGTSSRQLILRSSTKVGFVGGGDSFVASRFCSKVQTFTS